MKIFNHWKWLITLVILCLFSYFISLWIHAYPFIGNYIAFSHLVAITFGVLLLCTVVILLFLRFWPTWYRRIAAAIVTWIIGSEAVRWVVPIYIALDKEPPTWILSWFGPPSGATTLGAFFCIAVLSCLDYLERHGHIPLRSAPNSQLIDEQNSQSQIDVDRLRRSGARIEVVALIVCRTPEASVLLGQSPYHKMWMPPQEGVRLNETFKDALFRCLQVECGLNIPIDPLEFDRAMHLRSIRHVGTLELPHQRQGERPIAPDVEGTPMENIIMTKKAYWVATIILANQNDIAPKADGRELLDFKWYSFDDAQSVIQKTNHQEKARLLVESLAFCLNDLHGAPTRS